MRTAVLYDIHGNLPALESVLREVENEAFEQLVVGGDVIPGPMPVGTISALLQLDIPVHCIRGNGERELLALLEGAGSNNIPQPLGDGMRWVGEQLSQDFREQLSGWPSTCKLEISGIGSVLFCHATPDSDTEIFTRLTPEDTLLPTFENVGVDLVVCGHTHMQFDRKIGSVQVVNAGSVGMVFGDRGADWLALGPRVEFRHTLYEFEDAVRQIENTSYPGAKEFGDRNVLNPPSESEMLDVFEAARN